MWQKMPKPDPAPLDICLLDEIAPNRARGFELPLQSGPGEASEGLPLIVWRHGESVKAFINKCPHLGLPLETFPDKFLSKDGSTLICSAHGALFNADGACTSGPCQGDALTPVDVRLEARGPKRMIVLQRAAGHSEGQETRNSKP